ncbi:hypothetical protein MTOK_30000 [Mycolicibacterium tokaiense]|nr:hypothetical protein MTOK_30000 [Mycolicibacterium tokaiense]
MGVHLEPLGLQLFGQSARQIELDVAEVHDGAFFGEAADVFGTHPAGAAGYQRHLSVEKWLLRSGHGEISCGSWWVVRRIRGAKPAR